MNTFVQQRRENRSNANAGRKAGADGAALQLVDNRPAAITQRALDTSLNSSAKVQSQLQLKQMLNQSPSVTAQMKLAESLSSRQDSLQMKKVVQRQDAVEDEELAQRQPSLEEEEPLQGKLLPVQREVMPEEEEPMQGKLVQREVMPEEEEPMQTKAQVVQKQDGLEEEEPLQSKSDPVQKKENQTGLPDKLKAGVENLSGLAMDDVKVHYNSSKPAQMQALAYTQGTEIHVAPGQEKHLPHEAWHVAQQKQGRVQPTGQLKGVNLNTDTGLESEADRMGAQALTQRFAMQSVAQAAVSQLYPMVAQRAVLSTGQVIQLSGNVIQFEGGAIDKIKEVAAMLWDLIKKAHTTKVAPLILNALSLMTAAIRFAINDTSVGAQFGTGLLTLLTAVEAAWTAVEEWQAAEGEGKDLWKKRVDAIEKVTTSLILAASMFALPFNPTIAAAIGGIGAGSVKLLRSGYDAFANWYWGAPSGQQSQSSYGTIV